MTNSQTTFARVTLEYDKAHERAPLKAITEAIFEASRLSDCNAVVVRTAETAEALLTVLAGILVMSRATRCHQLILRALPPQRFAGRAFPREDAMKRGDQWRMTTARSRPTCTSGSRNMAPTAISLGKSGTPLTRNISTTAVPISADHLVRRTELQSNAAHDDDESAAGRFFEIRPNQMNSEWRV
jgi:hypothetical protein